MNEKMSTERRINMTAHRNVVNKTSIWIVLILWIEERVCWIVVENRLLSNIMHSRKQRRSNNYFMQNAIRSPVDG